VQAARPEAARVTVGEYIDRYLARYEREHKASSYTEARCQLTRFKREFADRVIGSIARHQAIEWADDKPGSLVKARRHHAPMPPWTRSY
jgi:hypothetical protein